MTPETNKRCQELEAEVKAIVDSWIADFPDDWSGKVRFVLALAKAISLMRDLVPALEGTGDDFIDAAKAGTVAWVEAGEPATRSGMIEATR